MRTLVCFGHQDGHGEVEISPPESLLVSLESHHNYEKPMVTTTTQELLTTEDIPHQRPGGRRRYNRPKEEIRLFTQPFMMDPCHYYDDEDISGMEDPIEAVLDNSQHRSEEEELYFYKEKVGKHDHADDTPLFPGTDPVFLVPSPSRSLTATTSTSMSSTSSHTKSLTSKRRMSSKQVLAAIDQFEDALEDMSVGHQPQKSRKQQKPKASGWKGMVSRFLSRPLPDKSVVPIKKSSKNKSKAPISTSESKASVISSKTAMASKSDIPIVPIKKSSKNKSKAPITTSKSKAPVISSKTAPASKSDAPITVSQTAPTTSTIDTRSKTPTRRKNSVSTSPPKETMVLKHTPSLIRSTSVPVSKSLSSRVPLTPLKLSKTTSLKTHSKPIKTPTRTTTTTKAASWGRLFPTKTKQRTGDTTLLLSKGQDRYASDYDDDWNVPEEEWGSSSKTNDTAHNTMDLTDTTVPRSSSTVIRQRSSSKKKPTFLSRIFRGHSSRKDQTPVSPCADNQDRTRSLSLEDEEELHLELPTFKNDEELVDHLVKICDNNTSLEEGFSHLQERLRSHSSSNLHALGESSESNGNPVFSTSFLEMRPASSGSSSNPTSSRASPARRDPRDDSMPSFASLEEFLTSGPNDSSHSASLEALLFEQELDKLTTEELAELLDTELEKLVREGIST